MTAATSPRGPAADCGCDDFAPSRRAFLRGAGATVGAAGLDTLTGGVFRQVAYADGTETDDNVLVVLSLRGGADGLSLVVPHGDPAYAAARPRIAVPPQRLLAANGFFGLHPALSALLPMWEDGKVAAVHAVGTPQPDRSHFSAMERVEDADPGSAERVGWLNRLAGLEGLTRPEQAVSNGSAMLPTALTGPSPVLGIKHLDGLGLPGPQPGSLQAGWKRRALDTLYAGGGLLPVAGRTALDVTQTLSDVPRTGSGAKYPAGPLGLALSDSARLVRARLARVVTVDYGNWDMHVDVGTLAAGSMQLMARELAQALAAFFADLGPHASRVTLVTVSEFGRRVSENGTGGLDHGYGNVMLVLGAGVVGGYHARWPGLDTGSLVDGDLAVTRDYRSVLWEIVSRRFDVPVSSLFPGFSPEAALGIVRSS